MFETKCNLKIRVVEKTGERVVDVLHKLDPWENTRCGIYLFIYFETVDTEARA